MILSKKHKVKLKDLIGMYDNNPRWSEYDWKTLEDSLRKEGLASKKFKYGYIRAHKSFFRKNKYKLIDGNHRVEILKTDNKIDEIEIVLVYRYVMMFAYIPIFLAVLLHIILMIISLGKIKILAKKPYYENR